jgi:hypothetical protein
VRLVEDITWYIVSNDYYLIDITMKPTTWGIWNPKEINNDQFYQDSRGLNSLEIIAWLISAYRLSRDEKYLASIRYLKSHGYMRNMVNQEMIYQVQVKNSAGSDDQLASLSYFTALYALTFFNNTFATEELGKDQIFAGIERSQILLQGQNNPLFNTIYLGGTGDTRVRDVLITDSLETLQQWPLDSIEWSMLNSHRTDYIKSSYDPNYSYSLLRSDERAFLNWNASPFILDSGTGGGNEAHAPFAWLLPYWMGRYYKHW